MIALNLTIIAILIGAYFYELNIHPASVEIGDLSKHIGEYVEVHGVVLKISENGRVLTITDDRFTSSALVYSPKSIDLMPGYRIVVRGIVNRYHGMTEITLRSIKDIQVRKRCLEEDIHMLLTNPERYRGLNVRVNGYVAYHRLIFLNVTDGWRYGHFYVNGDYRGERKTYFYGKVVDGSLYLENPINLNAYKNVSIDDLKNFEGKRVRVYGWVTGYYLHIILREDNSSLNVYFYGAEMPQGHVVLTGVFKYDSSRGEYLLRVGNP